jgi:transposase-like protein
VFSLGNTNRLMRILPHCTHLINTEVRSATYRNNVIGQDHRNIKSRTKAMRGFQRLRGAATTISGIELMHRIRRGQFNLAMLDLEDTTTLTDWNSVLSVQ